MAAVSEAILPITVLSPMRMTIPRATPSVAFVEKKARFSVSSALVLVIAVERCCGSASPVNDELST